ncbi:transglycosylase [Pseudoxanthomonas kalamensis DSM 18571]|uniref:lytic transglycosylase domain-containing protein n=1 Tax=Pseudoxanthomonas kalamensis TaxID=289483 RepID=UPI001391CBA2|nr:lytic transglycosylase domain-containing protein [Pseudoxanthomonas kalamensis]KAF1709467.1 transglycosylase [Pseudoxanthomonas kalamensis DSM 18571]
MKGVPLALMVGLALAAAVPASAGTLYRCTGSDGVPNYVSKRVPNAQCEVVSRYTPERNPAPSRPSTVSTPAKPATTAGMAMGSVDASLPSVTASPSTPMPARSTGTRRVVSGQVYSYVKDGVRHYTSSRPKGSANVASLRTIKYSFIETCFACGNPGLNFGKLRLNTTAYQSEIASAAREFGVEEAVIRAIMHAESSYNPMALSHAGAQGLMQLMPATATRFGVTNAYDPAQNIRGGVKYLSWLLKRYQGDLGLAAAGYNAGEGAVDRHGGVPPYRETRRYVERVKVLADRYRGTVASR